MAGSEFGVVAADDLSLVAGSGFGIVVVDNLNGIKCILENTGKKGMLVDVWVWVSS